MDSWYSKCMPKIKDVKPHIKKTLSSLKDVDGVKSIYIWGSYARNINKPNFRVKDIDVLARTSFHSGDLLAINNDIVKSICSDNYLENQGYDPDTIKFSKHFLRFSKYNVDCWAISNDRKLVHWGPICMNKKESEEISKEAERYASNNTGRDKKRIDKAASHIRENWYDHYCRYLDSCFEGMPTGWYKTENIKVKNILSQAIKL